MTVARGRLAPQYPATRAVLEERDICSFCAFTQERQASGGRMELTNRGWQTLFGRQPTAVTGQPVFW